MLRYTSHDHWTHPSLWRKFISFCLSVFSTDISGGTRMRTHTQCRTNLHQSFSWCFLFHVALFIFLVIWVSFHTFKVMMWKTVFLGCWVCVQYLYVLLYTSLNQQLWGSTLLAAYVNFQCRIPCKIHPNFIKIWPSFISALAEQYTRLADEDKAEMKKTLTQLWFLSQHQ